MEQEHTYVNCQECGRRICIEEDDCPGVQTEEGWVCSENCWEVIAGDD